MESTKQEALDWKRKHDHLLSKQKADEDQINSEIRILRSRTSAAEARLAAAHEQTRSAKEEAAEWKRKYDITVRETKAALEKAAVLQERTSKETQLREDALREEFSSRLTEKEEELKEKNGKIEKAEQRLTTLNLELKLESEELVEKLESVNARAQSYEREARILEQEKIHLERKYQSEFERFAEVQERCNYAEKESKRATELADIARADAASAQKEKSELQKLAMERLAQIERAQRHIEGLERARTDLADAVDRMRASEMDALSKVSLLEQELKKGRKK
ncbi:hypothetical protein GH714_016171 [Hevea brasiliensis]|uniref:Uncharacterized protein n=1 Tax=Hevea brasiliensis TaxID=3981 RepID=A0A6A6LT86_HEVBR|nr:hypothetical protein GH714_016171 [Hevea brasiliensis]